MLPMITDCRLPIIDCRLKMSSGWVVRVWLTLVELEACVNNFRLSGKKMNYLWHPPLVTFIATTDETVVRRIF